MRYVSVARLEELPANGGLAVDVEGERVALFLVDGEVFAVADECTHAKASLAEGEVCDGEVTCPRHGAIFDVRSGEAIGTPAEEDLRTWPVRVVDGDVQVGV